LSFCSIYSTKLLYH